MIGYLHGRPQVIGEHLALVFTQGVGYEVTCSQNTLGDLDGLELADLWVYTHVREDQITLFGFSKIVEKKMFHSLIKVNGIGPRLAIGILSAASTSDLAQMIEEGNVKRLTQLPKVGKKTAEQIILSLKGQLVEEEGEGPQRRFPLRQDIVSALVHLGFRLQEVEGVVDQLDPQSDLQSGVRSALSLLTN